MPRRSTSPLEYDCRECGRHCKQGENVAPHARRYCSHECNRIANKRQYREARATEARRAARRREAAARLERHVRGDGRWESGPCSECGESFTCRVNRGDRAAVNRYCSQRCYRRVMQRNRRHRLRAAATGAPVRFHEIAERDGWVCQICWAPVDREATVPAPGAPVLDHAQSLALGGRHDPGNVQLAHFLCNSYKGRGEAALSDAAA